MFTPRCVSSAPRNPRAGTADASSEETKRLPQIRGSRVQASGGQSGKPARGPGREPGGEAGAKRAGHHGPSRLSAAAGRCGSGEDELHRHPDEAAPGLKWKTKLGSVWQPPPPGLPSAAMECFQGCGERRKNAGVSTPPRSPATDSTKQTGRFTNLGVGSGGGEIKGQGVWLSRG